MAYTLLNYYKTHDKKSKIRPAEWRQSWYWGSTSLPPSSQRGTHYPPTLPPHRLIRLRYFLPHLQIIRLYNPPHIYLSTKLSYGTSHDDLSVSLPVSATAAVSTSSNITSDVTVKKFFFNNTITRLICSFYSITRHVAKCLTYYCPTFMKCHVITASKWLSITIMYMLLSEVRVFVQLDTGKYGKNITENIQDLEKETRELGNCSNWRIITLLVRILTYSVFEWEM